MERLLRQAEVQVALSGLRGSTLAELFENLAEDMHLSGDYSCLSPPKGEALSEELQTVLWSCLVLSQELTHHQWTAADPLPSFSSPEFPQETMPVDGPERGLLCERAGDHWRRVDCSVYSEDGLPPPIPSSNRQMKAVLEQGGRYLLVASQRLRNEVLGLEGGGHDLFHPSFRSGRLAVGGGIDGSSSGIPLRVVRAEHISNEQYAVLEYIGKHGRKGVLQSRLFHCFGKKASHIVRALRLRHRLVGRVKVLYQEEQDGAFTNNFMVWTAALMPPQAAVDVAGLSSMLEAAERSTPEPVEKMLPSTVQRKELDNGWPLVLPLVPMQMMVVSLLQQATAQTLRCNDVKKAVMLHSKARWRTFKKSMLESGMVEEVKVKVAGSSASNSLRLLSPTPTGDDNEGEDGEDEEGSSETGTPVEYSIDRLILRSVKDAGTKGTTQPEIREMWGLGEKLVQKKVALFIKLKMVVAERQHYGRKQVLVLYTPENFANREGPIGAGQSAVSLCAAPATQVANGEKPGTSGEGLGEASATTPSATEVRGEGSTPILPRTTVQQRQIEQLILEHVREQSFALKRSLSSVLRSIMLQRGLASPDGPRLDVRTTSRYLKSLITRGALESRKVEITNNRGQRVPRELILVPGVVLDMDRVEEQLREAAVLNPAGVVSMHMPKRAKKEVIELDAMDTIVTGREPTPPVASTSSGNPAEAKRSAAAARLQYGYLEAVGVRLANLHNYLLKELLPDAGSQAATPFPALSQQFSVSHMLDRMPVTLFAQTIGISSVIEGLEEHLEARTPLGLLTPSMKADIFDAGDPKRLYAPFNLMAKMGLIKRDNSGSTFVTVGHWARFELDLRQRFAYSPGLQGDALTHVTLHSEEEIAVFWRTLEYECTQEHKAANKGKRRGRKRKSAADNEESSQQTDGDEIMADVDDDEEMTDVQEADASAASSSSLSEENSAEKGVVDVRNAPRILQRRAWLTSKLLSSPGSAMATTSRGDPILLPFPSLESMSLFSGGRLGNEPSPSSLLLKRRRRQRSSGASQASGTKKRKGRSGQRRKRRDWSEDDSLVLLRRFVSYQTADHDDEELLAVSILAPIDAIELEGGEERTEREEEGGERRALTAKWGWIAEVLPHSPQQCKQKFRDMMKFSHHREWVTTRLKESATHAEIESLPETVEELLESYAVVSLSHDSDTYPTTAGDDNDTEMGTASKSARVALLQDTALGASLTSDLIYQPTEHRRLLEQYGQQNASETMRELRESGLIASSKTPGSNKNYSVSSKFSRTYDAFLDDYCITSAPVEVEAVKEARRKALAEGLLLVHRDAPAFSETFFLDSSAFCAAVKSSPTPLAFPPMASGGQVAGALSLAQLGLAGTLLRHRTAIGGGTKN